MTLAEVALQVVLGLLLLAGCTLGLLAAVGVYRFPDVFCRMHAATKPATLGMVLVAFATAVAVTGTGNATKLVLVVVLQLLTAPVGAHMVGRAAYRSGVRMTRRTVMDELADRQRGSEQDHEA